MTQAGPLFSSPDMTEKGCYLCVMQLTLRY